jgi:hypothetical protein
VLADGRLVHAFDGDAHHRTKRLPSPPPTDVEVARLLATVRGRIIRLLPRHDEDHAVVEKILTHLGLPAAPPCPSPARTPAWLPGVRRAADHEHDAGGHWAD